METTTTTVVTTDEAATENTTPEGDGIMPKLIGKTYETINM